MKKWFYGLMIAVLVFAFKGISLVNAETTNFLVSASVPLATGVSITASSVNSSGTPVFTPVAGTTLSFDPMTYDTTNNIYLPDHFFAIDVGAIDGAGSPDVTVDYQEGTNPNDPGKGLGWHASAAFVRVEGATGSQTEVPLASHPKKLLKDLVSENITIADTTGGFLRIYTGIVTGDATTPADGIPFSNGDRPGTYDGTLIVTGTVI